MNELGGEGVEQKPAYASEIAASVNGNINRNTMRGEKTMST